MEVRNQHPAQLTVLHMPPARATVQDAGEAAVRWDNSYSSLFLSGQGAGNTFAMDGEILRTSISGHVGLGAGLQLDLELPIGHTTGGFLDQFVIGWHDLFGFPEQGRGAAPKGRFQVVARRQGADALVVDERTGWLDVPVGLTWGALQPGEDQPWGLALRGAVELPVGDEDAGFGNGEFDFALGGVGEWRGERLGVHAFLQHTWAGTPRRARAAGLSYADVTSGGVGLEAALGADTSALLQTEWETSTLRDLGFDRVDDPQWLLWVGLRQRLWKSLFGEVALGEDLSEFVAPDFSVFVGLAWLP